MPSRDDAAEYSAKLGASDEVSSRLMIATKTYFHSMNIHVLL